MLRLLPFIALLLLAGCDRAPSVAVEDAVVRLPVIEGRPGAAYFTLRANTTPMQIVGITSPEVERIDLHESVNEGGVMRMGPLRDRAFPADGEKRFEPGGAHAMLFGIAPTVRPGGTIEMTFDFDNAPDVTVRVPMEAIGGGGHDGH